jgi:putative oxidoreductase
MDDQLKSDGSSNWAKALRLGRKIAEILRCPFLLAVRLYWGWQFFLTGKGKLMNLDRTTAFFHDLRIPLPHLNAWVVALTECFGGLLLMAGLGARFVAALLAFDMIVAYLTADIDKVKHIFNDPDKFVTADPFLFMFASMIIFLFGPGHVSLDWLIGKLCRKPSN